MYKTETLSHTKVECDIPAAYPFPCTVGLGKHSMVTNTEIFGMSGFLRDRRLRWKLHDAEVKCVCSEYMYRALLHLHLL